MVISNNNNNHDKYDKIGYGTKYSDIAVTI